MEASHHDRRPGLRPLCINECRRYNLPCFPISLILRPGDDVPSLILLLRRFLRGYDRIGVDERGRLMALVYVPLEHADGVLGRMGKVLGERVRLEIAAPAVAQLQSVA